jgi:subtilisin family serine protease
MRSAKRGGLSAVYTKLLRIEPLESRRLMAVAGLASQIAPMWFQSVANPTDVEHAGTATWTAEDTIVPSVSSTAAAQAAGANLYDWIVQFNTASLGAITSVAQTTSLLAGDGIDFEVLHGLGLAGMVLVRSSGASMNNVEHWLTSDVNVASFEQDAYRAADATSSTSSTSTTSTQWDLAAVNAPAAWNMTTGSSSVVVAVIDTGVDYNHVDLSANIWTNPNAGSDGFTGDVHGYNFVADNGNPMDDNGHGTHVAGTIAAEANSYGVTGVAYSTTIMPLKFLDANGSGYLSDAVESINYATMERTVYGVNVRVDNCSWGGGGFSAAMQTAIQAAGNAGIMVVTAAGNNGTNNDTSPQYPANYDLPNVISVAASNQNNQLASFSNFGATTVDIAAPGVSIYSTTPNNTYSTYSGTSMATPHVSAVAALAWALDPSATVAQVRNAILQGADRVGALSGKLVSGGVLDAYNTLKLLQAASLDKPVVGSLAASSSSVTAGATVTLTAQAITDAGAPVTNVRFVLDTNNNGQYDSTDTILGSTSTITGGNAGSTLNTTGYAAGTYHILAAAQNSKGNWSAWVATTLTVLPGDDHGNNAATATAVGVPSSTAGTIGTAGDVDWFKVQATAGKTYVFTVALGTLHDSVLYLYDTNGQKQLAFNDDYGGTLASQISWTATSGGTYFLDVGGYANRTIGTYSLNVQVKNAAATPSAVAPASLAARSVENVPATTGPNLPNGTAAQLACAAGEWLGNGSSGEAVATVAAASVNTSTASLSDEVFARLATDDVSPASQNNPLAMQDQSSGDALAGDVTGASAETSAQLGQQQGVAWDAIDAIFARLGELLPS